MSSVVVVSTVVLTPKAVVPFSFVTSCIGDVLTDVFPPSLVSTCIEVVEALVDCSVLRKPSDVETADGVNIEEVFSPKVVISGLVSIFPDVLLTLSVVGVGELVVVIGRSVVLGEYAVLNISDVKSRVGELVEYT